MEKKTTRAVMGVGLLAGLVLVGCDLEESKDDTGDTDTGTEVVDEDGDGFAVEDDCDDADAAINPDAEEVCDEVDNNCDGAVDEGVTTTFYADGDGDGFGGETSADACAAPTGYVTEAGDCDDSLDVVFPDNPEVCDELDNNCDGTIDEGVTTTYYPDYDGDGYGVADKPVDACAAPKAHVETPGDCEDADRAINPGAAEVCDGLDNDCDAKTGEAGMASFVDATGAWTDVTGDFSGTSASVGENTLSDDGALYLCEATWHERFDLAADVSIIGIGEPSLVVIDGADTTGSMITSSSAGISASVEGVTITGGIGDGLLLGDTSYPSGGGVHCYAALDLTLSDVIITDNAATVGGGLFTEGCTVDINDSEISNNDGSYLGGGITILDGAITVTDSLIEGNSGSAIAGGIFAGDYFSGASVTLDGTLVTGNTAGLGAGAYLELGAAMSCTGDSKTTAGFHSNIAKSGGGGVFVASGSSLASSSCDWGVSLTADDNATDDVSVSSGTSYTYEDDETFSCDDSACK